MQAPIDQDLAPAAPISRPPRPLGVWLLTIYAFLLAGVMPVALSLFFIAAGALAWNTPETLFSIVLSIGIIVFAAGAFLGKEKARLPLMVFVSLYYVLIGINNLLLVMTGQVPDGAQTQLWSRVFRGILFPVMYIWYFQKSTTRNFFS